MTNLSRISIIIISLITIPIQATAQNAEGNWKLISKDLYQSRYIKAGIEHVEYHSLSPAGTIKEAELLAKKQPKISAFLLQHLNLSPRIVKAQSTNLCHADYRSVAGPTRSEVRTHAVCGDDSFIQAEAYIDVVNQAGPGSAYDSGYGSATAYFRKISADKTNCKPNNCVFSGWTATHVWNSSNGESGSAFYNFNSDGTPKD